VVLSHRGNAGMLFQAAAGFYFRIAGGFINASLNSVSAIPLPVALLSDANLAREEGFFSYVQSAGIGAIIVERAWSEPWMYVFTKLGMQSLTVGGVTMYSTKSGHVVGAPAQRPWWVYPSKSWASVPGARLPPLTTATVAPLVPTRSA
jgi:hypothetical protein